MANRFLYLVRHGEAIDEGDLSERGRQQAEHIGERLSSVPISTIFHSPLPRAAQTTELMAKYLPEVQIQSTDLLGDYIPSVPDEIDLPPALAQLIDSYSAAELDEGPKLATAAIEKFARATEEDQHELIITHNFLIGWFVRHALDAPAWRWLGLNHCNCALTIILYRPERSPSLVSYNDIGHLPPTLRWTGLPYALPV